MVFKWKENGKYITFLREFLTKIFFISKHFNYNIHFLNIGSVRWHPLLSTHCRKCFWNFCITSCSMLGEINATSSVVICFKSTVVLRSFSYNLLFRYAQRHWDRVILQAIHNSFFVRSRELGTSHRGLAVWAIAPYWWNQPVWVSTSSLRNSDSRKCA